MNPDPARNTCAAAEQMEEEAAEAEVAAEVEAAAEAVAAAEEEFRVGQFGVGTVLLRVSSHVILVINSPRLGLGEGVCCGY